MQVKHWKGIADDGGADEQALDGGAGIDKSLMLSWLKIVAEAPR